MILGHYFHTFSWHTFYFHVILHNNINRIRRAFPACPKQLFLNTPMIAAILTGKLQKSSALNAVIINDLQ